MKRNSPRKPHHVTSVNRLQIDGDFNKEIASQSSLPFVTVIRFYRYSSVFDRCVSFQIVEVQPGAVCNGKVPWTSALFMHYKRKPGDISNTNPRNKTEDNFVRLVKSRCLGPLLVLTACVL